MNFEKGYMYHIYNQGNNRQKIFFQSRNYAFFLQKIALHIKPFADIIAYCLMPNHFHLMVYVRETTQPMTPSHRLSKEDEIPGMTPSHRLSNQTLNQSIAIMLRSYTRAIHKQEGTSGALFRPKTKAECVNCPKGITPSFILYNGITVSKSEHVEKEYPQVCFDYIHQNPVRARMVMEDVDWEFSSAREYQNLRKGNLVNKAVAAEYVDFFR